MDIQTLIQQELSITSFACSSLTRLSGGTANFVYRGVLSTPLADGTSTVIVKHAEDYLASNEEFKLSAKRCLIEERALDAQQRGQCSSACNSGHGRDSKIIARTPKLYHTSHATNTLVMEDLPDAVDLKTFLRSPDLSQNISREQAFAIGRATGLWLSSFHARMSDPQMEDTAQAFSDNKTMRELKFSVNYDGLVNMVDRYPDLLGDCRAVFEEVRQFAAAELEENGIEDQDKREMRIGRTGPIHGDFWSGKYVPLPF
ncbi:kinase-like domain-containing protein [Aspergillus unguis]